MAIVPDLKDWTWILARSCPECGFAADQVSASDVPAELRENVAVWLSVLQRPDARLRPRADVWSPTEYACHVRDVCRVFAQRVDLMLSTEEPHFANWDQDQTAIEERYDEQDPAVVAKELTNAANDMAATLERVAGDQWERTGERSDGSRFTIDSLSRYFLHDVVHHRYDVTGEPAGALR